MEVTKNQGPESPADLKWSQGAKNPRKENEILEETKIDLGMLSSETTDQVVEAGIETPNGEICTEPKTETSSHLDLFKGSRKVREKQIHDWCLNIIKSNEYVQQKCTSSPLVVVILDVRNPKGTIEDENANKIIEKLTKVIVGLSGNKISPKFNDFEIKEGFIIINCYDNQTVLWLKKSVTREFRAGFKNELRAMSDYDFSNFTRVSAFLPGSRKNEPQIRRLLFGQNLSLQWTVMKVFRSRTVADESGVIVLFEINEIAFEELNKLSMKPYFGLSRGEFNVCSSFDEWKSHLFKPYPRTTLASQFHCRNFFKKIKSLKERRRLSNRLDAIRRKKKRRRAEKKNQAADHSEKRSKVSEQKKPKRRSERLRNLRDRDDDRRLRTSSRFSSPDRSRGFLDDRKRVQSSTTGLPTPWSGPSQSPSYVIPELTQISQLLSQMQERNRIDLNKERIPQAFHYNIEQPTSSHQFQMSQQFPQHPQSSFQPPNNYDNSYQYSESRNRNQYDYDYHSSREQSPNRSWTSNVWNDQSVNEEPQNFNYLRNLSRDTQTRYNDSYSDRYDARIGRNRNNRQNFQQPQNRFDFHRR